MNMKERHEHLKSILPNYSTSEDEVIHANINRLIEALYVPSNVPPFYRTDPLRLSHFELDREPINWGALKCIEVKPFKDGSFIALIEEAAPGQCPTLCNYIETYMQSFGWTVKVETEW